MISTFHYCRLLSFLTWTTWMIYTNAFMSPQKLHVSFVPSTKTSFLATETSQTPPPTPTPPPPNNVEFMDDPDSIQNDMNPNESNENSILSLPNLFPLFQTSLNKLGYVTPTPIQQASAKLALDPSNNLILIAPTGSGKTLSYLLPALTNAIEKDGTVLVVAPTRELSVQLMKDTISLLSNLPVKEKEEGEDTQKEDHELPSVLLTVRGVDIPTKTDIMKASIIIGTPAELLFVLSTIQGSQRFLAGNVLSTVILDEVDVLLPNNSKQLRTALDSNRKGRGRDGAANNNSSNSAQYERRRQEQKRKRMAARRRGEDISSSSSSPDHKVLLTDTDKLLRMIASRRFTGGEASSPFQILAGSATSSRRTMDRLNRALQDAASEVSSTTDVVWSGDVQACRPTVVMESAHDEENDTAGQQPMGDNHDNTQPQQQQQQQQQQKQKQPHTIRSVTVPSQVTHRYISMDKQSALSSKAVLSNLAKAANILKPETALIFICGEFGKSNKVDKTKTSNPIKGATYASRRNAQYRKKKITAEKAKKEASQGSSSSTETLSARQACSTLAELGIDAKPLHVVLGFELNAKNNNNNDNNNNNKEEEEKKKDESQNKTKPFLVTFEGSARGLHFDAVDAVFIVGRPSSAASYLHLAGRVGRSSVAQDGSGNVVIRPGSVISFCTKGSAKELDKWTRQIGGTALEEFLF